MGLEHHLVFWGNFIIWSIGLICCYEYNMNTDGFVANYNCAVTFARGYTGRTQSATVMLVCKILALIFIAFTVFRSSPWK